MCPTLHCPLQEDSLYCVFISPEDRGSHYSRGGGLLVSERELFRLCWTFTGAPAGTGGGGLSKYPSPPRRQLLPGDSPPRLLTSPWTKVFTLLPCPVLSFPSPVPLRDLLCGHASSFPCGSLSVQGCQCCFRVFKTFLRNNLEF